MKHFLLSLLILLILVTACATSQKPLSEAIIGTWENPNGFSIQFMTGGNGFIPGVPGKIPDSAFTYSIVDESHVKIDLEGQNQTIEVTIAGDQLTWKDKLGEVIYKRIK